MHDDVTPNYPSQLPVTSTEALTSVTAASCDCTNCNDGILVTQWSRNTGMFSHGKCWISCKRNLQCCDLWIALLPDRDKMLENGGGVTQKSILHLTQNDENLANFNPLKAIFFSQFKGVHEVSCVRHKAIQTKTQNFPF